MGPFPIAQRAGYYGPDPRAIAAFNFEANQLIQYSYERYGGPGAQGPMVDPYTRRTTMFEVYIRPDGYPWVRPLLMRPTTPPWQSGPPPWQASQPPWQYDGPPGGDPGPAQPQRGGDAVVGGSGIKLDANGRVPVTNYDAEKPKKSLLSRAEHGAWNVGSTVLGLVGFGSLCLGGLALLAHATVVAIPFAAVGGIALLVGGGINKYNNPK